MTKSSAKALERYRNKRDPVRTNEPFGAERIARPGETWTGSFVVHQHGARRLHFDLRIEVAGSLASFAVPRGPSLDPADKRLAVQTENHPLEYLDFEDVIPEGNYGAGPMIVWDTGSIAYLEQPPERGLQTGKLDFLLSGHKLRGRFALVLTGRGEERQRQWLLLKKPDGHVREGRDVTESEPYSVLSGLRLDQLRDRAEVARELERRAAERGAPEGEVVASELVPMLCTLEDGELAAGDRLYELKLDGVRIVGHKHDDMVALRYRSLKQATTSYPEVVRALRALAPTRIVLDGEIVTYDDAGRPSFQRLAPRIHANRPEDVARARVACPVQYVVFDLLQIGSRDLRGLPLVERKELLSALLPGRGVMWSLDHVLGDGRALFEWCRGRGLEGVVSKVAGGSYRSGPRRTGDWIKIKCGREEDFVVVGWVTGSRSRKSLGALELATWDGERYCYRGRVGSGLSEARIVELLERLEPLVVEESPAVGEALPHAGETTFARPELVVRVAYLEWTDEGRLRHPVFRRLRDDVAPTDCRDAPPHEAALPAHEVTSPELEPEPASASGEGACAGVPPGGETGVVQVSSRFEPSNRDKVFWPDEGYTKGDLLDYYAAISDTLLPHLEDRPVMLVRYPDGIAGKSFYQWNVPRGTPDWINTLSLRDEERDGKRVATFLVDSADALLHVINLGCIPLHVLASRRSSLEHCDFITIDIDLGEQPLLVGIKLLLSLRDLLQEIELEGFPKTSGQTGLHVLVPLGPGVPFAVAKSLVELIGRLLQLRHPEESTMQRRVADRGGRAYIDTGQTGKSRTIVAPYSVRAYPGARVSTPLSWEEVHGALDPGQLSMFTVPSRVVERGDPLARLLDVRPDIARAVAALGRLLRG